MKRKGFTLIELLAVIVVLAVIMVIAVPKILDVIESSRMSAAKSSAEFYIDAIEKNNALSQLDNSKNLLISDGEYDDVTTLNVNVKGEKPTSGSITIEKGRVKEASLCVSGYNVEYNNRTATVTGKCGSEEEVYKEEPILEKAKALVYENGTCKTDGTTYNYMDGCYIKGASTNNYVWYNGFMWRIMGINSDGTVRLITDENVTAIPYGASNTAENYATNTGYIHSWLNDYFYNKLNSTKSIIQNGSYFCSETIGATLTDDTVRTKCTSGKEVKASVGLISYDEYYLAGESSSYLNIGHYFWTMTSHGSYYAWHVNNSGYADYFTVQVSSGVRPVINVSSPSTITKGDGTASNYYVLSENKDSDKTGTLGENVTSGEYVKLEGKTYRVVSKESDGIKLILDGYYEELEGTTYTMSYGSDNTFTLDSGIGQKLNIDVLESLGFSTSNKIVTTTWYQGDEMDYGFKYTDALKQTNGVSAKVGLIRVGEMLSGQSSTILTKNYTVTSSYNNVTDYWAMNKFTHTSVAWYVNNSGNAGSSDVANTRGIRPVIKVKTDLTISKGNGTWDNPYEI